MYEEVAWKIQVKARRKIFAPSLGWGADKGEKGRAFTERRGKELLDK